MFVSVFVLVCSRQYSPLTVHVWYVVVSTHARCAESTLYRFHFDGARMWCASIRTKIKTAFGQQLVPGSTCTVCGSRDDVQACQPRKGMKQDSS